MPSIGQTWVLASIGAVVEMGILSTLKRLLMGSNSTPAFMALSRQHDLHTFSQKLRYGWEKSVNNVSSKLLQIKYVKFSRQHCQYSKW
jgi:hypothetical protein